MGETHEFSVSTATALGWLTEYNEYSCSSYIGTKVMTS